MADKTSVFVDNSAPSVDDNWLNMTQQERNNIIVAGGLTPSVGANDQVGKALSTIIANVDYYTDSGSADAYVLSVISPNLAPQSYRIGMRIRWRTSNANTGGSCTVNVAGLGQKNIKLEDGSTDPSSGDISNSLENTAVYDGTNFRLVKGGRSVFDNLQINNKSNTQRANKTISSGAITFTNSFISIIGEGDVTDTLTDITGGVLGDRLIIYCGTAYNITVAHNASKINLYGNINIDMQNGDILKLVCIGSNIWLEEANSSIQNRILSSKTTNGYTYLPNGLIYQWGTSASVSPAGGTQAVSFPLTFGSSILQLFLTWSGAPSPDNAITSAQYTSLTTSGFTAVNRDPDSTCAMNWLAIGY